MPNSKIALADKSGASIVHIGGGLRIFEEIQKKYRLFEGFLINIYEGHSSFAQASIESKLLMGSADMEGGEEGVR